MKILNSLIIPAVGISTLCTAWEERPGQDDHREQDRRYNEAQTRSGCSDYECRADRPSWRPESGGEYDRSSAPREEIGTVGRPENNGNRD